MTRTKRKIIKFSNYSFCITLPKKAIEALGWKKGQEVSVNFDPKSKKISIFRSRKADTIPKSPSRKTRKAEKVQPIPRLRW
jgi:bifunctional DNA-binding transcriptional regulator/antitoxin component of YhaV-PrlF toxin-antitoxin module